MRYAWLAIAIFAARFLATAIAFPQLDGDIAWQRWLGTTILATHTIPHTLGTETFTAAGAPWLAQEWAFSLFAALAGHGLGWVVFASVIALAAIAALVVASAHAERMGASPRANALCTALAGVALFASFGVRAQVAAWPLLAVVLSLLDVESPLAYLAIGVAAVWSNLHASAMLAPVLAAVSAIGTCFDEGAASVNARRRALIAVGSGVAICCNPFGIRLPLYALGLFGAPFKAAISEWKPTDLGDASFAFGALPLLLIALVFFAGPTRRRVRDTLVLATFAYLLLAATRNVALFGIVALPLAASALTRNAAFFGRRANDLQHDRMSRYGLPAITALIAAVVTVGLLHSEPTRTDTVAAHAMASIARQPGTHRVFCADFAWCGLAVGVPHESVFLDGRADPYPARVWADYLRIARVHADWARTTSGYDVNTIVVEKASPLDSVVAESHAWNAGFSDANYRVWYRRGSR